MSVTVQLLASPLRGLVDNRPELELPFMTGETVAALLERLFRAYPTFRPETMDEAGELLYEYQIWHEGEMVRGEGFRRILKDGDTLAFLLPIAGGSCTSSCTGWYSGGPRMKVILRNQGKEIEVTGRRRVRELLTELGVLPETVLVIRGRELLTIDEVVRENDVIELRPVISGGRA